MAKTIGERVNDYVQRYDEYDRGICRDVAERAYIQAAIEQHKIDIGKAICWLQTQNLTRGRTGFINDFKKAMEE